LGAVPGALSVTVRVPLRAPFAEGVKVTLTWQVFPEGPGGTVVHPFDTANSVGFDETTLETVTGEFPVLVRVTVWGLG
jgi:hypothetical protein